MSLINRLASSVLSGGGQSVTMVFDNLREHDSSNYGTGFTALDEGQTYQKQSKREQTIDTHGNVTQVKIYDFGSGTTPAPTPARVYDNTYANAGALTTRHIWNRLASAVLSGGGQSVTMVSNTYDAYVHKRPVHKRQSTSGLSCATPRVQLDSVKLSALSLHISGYAVWAPS